MQPAITVQSFSCSFWVPQVASEHTGALHTDLKGTKPREESAGTKTINGNHILRLADLSLSFLSIVVHFRDVYQLHHGTGQRSTNVSCWRQIRVPTEGWINRRRALRLRRHTTCAPVSWHGESAACSALCLTVALKDETAQNSSEEGQHSGGDGR